MRELTIIIDPVTNVVLLESPEHVPTEVLDQLTEAWGRGQEIACAVPLTLLPPPAASPEETAASTGIRIAGYYHNSLIEGPGRRSTAKLQGCGIHCRGCSTPESWNPLIGTHVPVDVLAGVLLDPGYERDGVTIAGGEPFSQPQGLWALVQALRIRGCRHILVYSGYPYERLQRMAERQPAIGAVLDDAEVLIDGPFVAALADRGGPWTGSTNQRVIDLVATRRAGRVILLGSCPQDCDRPLVENALDQVGMPNVTIRRASTFHR